MCLHIIKSQIFLPNRFLKKKIHNNWVRNFESLMHGLIYYMFLFFFFPFSMRITWSMCLHMFIFCIFDKVKGGSIILRGVVYTLYIYYRELNHSNLSPYFSCFVHLQVKCVNIIKNGKYRFKCLQVLKLMI